MMGGVRISVVIIAPGGVGQCPFLDEMLADAAEQSDEVIVADGSISTLPVHRAGLVHLSVPGASSFRLMREGFLRATGDWIVSGEDHCRLLPGGLAAYRAAIEEQPQVDLFSGTLVNETSVSDWSYACFLHNFHSYWPAGRTPPSGASRANLIVRRTAILPSELQSDGGLVWQTFPRLTETGRYAHCAGAVSDHVKPLAGAGALRHQFLVARQFVALERQLQPVPMTGLRLLRHILGLVRYSLTRSWRLMRSIRHTPQYRRSMGVKVTLMGLANIAAVAWVDIGNTFSKPDQAC
jgi:hypothetical protein